MLEVKRISKDFKDQRVLHDLDLTIDDGKVFGLVGINGAGKSTLLRSIAGVYDIDEGEILFDGEVIKDDPEIRRNILLIGDDPYFQRTSTIEDIVTFYSSFYRFDREAYYKYLNMFYLDPKKPINTFSKGMKRQVFLIMALAIKPRLLLLDEAFDGLDPITRLDFKKGLAELLSDEAISVIISSHNLKELEDICDSFGLLEDGKIKTSGDLEIAKSQVNKYQVVFDEEKGEDMFNDLDIVDFEKRGRVITMVIKGDQEIVTKRLESFKPLILDILPVDFEELFIYEVEKRGSLHE